MTSSAVLALSGGLSLLAEAANALVYVMFLVVNVVVILLRLQRPDAERPFKIAGSIKQVPILPILGIVSTLAMSFQLQLQPLVMALALLAIGVMLHTAGQHFSQSTAPQ